MAEVIHPLIRQNVRVNRTGSRDTLHSHSWFSSKMNAFYRSELIFKTCFMYRWWRPRAEKRTRRKIFSFLKNKCYSATILNQSRIFFNDDFQREDTSLWGNTWHYQEVILTEIGRRNWTEQFVRVTWRWLVVPARCLQRWIHHAWGKRPGKNICKKQTNRK